MTRARNGAAPVAPAGASRSGKNVSPRHVVQLPAAPDELARFRAAAEEEGLPLGQWLVEAARAYKLMGKRPDAQLTDEDWRKVVRG